MHSLPLISHRMFLAAMGQKYQPPQTPRPNENRRTPQPAQVSWAALSDHNPRREPRALVATLVPSHF